MDTVGDWSVPLGMSIAVQESIERHKKAYCSVKYCYTNSAVNPDLSFFRLPNDPNRASLWLSRIKVKSSTKRVLVCEKHFDPSSVSKNNKSRKRLMSHALPYVAGSAEDLECTPDVDHQDMSGHVDNMPSTPRHNNKRIRLKKTHVRIQNFMKKTPQARHAESYRSIAELIRLHGQFRLPNKGEMFSEEFKIFALKLYYLCPNTYKVMQSILRLPKISTLYRLLIPSSTELCENFILALQTKVRDMAQEQRECVVCIGTMDLKAYLDYDSKKDLIVGLHEVDGAQVTLSAKKALVVIVRGLYDNWKQMLPHSFLANDQDYKDVRMYILKILHKVFHIGLNVRVLISDVESDFIGLSKEKRINAKDPFFYVNNNKVYYMYDTAHLMRNMYESFTNNNVYFKGKTAKWQHITAVYNHEFRKPLRLAPKLTSKHIAHDHQSDNVKITLAAEVFSVPTAAAVATYQQLKVIDEPVDGTVEWILLINKLFSMFNFTTVNDNDEMRALFTGEEENLVFMNDVITIFKDLRLADAQTDIDTTHNAKFLYRLKAAIKVFVSLYRDLNGKYDKLPTGLNRDCLDKFILKVRQQYGGLPTCKDLQLSMIKVPISFFKSTGKKNTDNVDYFTNYAISFSGALRTYYKPKIESDHPSDAAFEVTSRVDLESVELPEQELLQHLAAFLLYEGYERHRECARMQRYALSTADSTPVILVVNSKNLCDAYSVSSYNTVVVMLPTNFLHFVKSMELRFKQYFETEYQRKVLQGLRQHLFSKDVTFCMPCKCFPIAYIKCLYLRYRFHLLLKFNNKEYENYDESTYLAVNDL